MSADDMLDYLENWSPSLTALCLHEWNPRPNNQLLNHLAYRPGLHTLHITINDLEYRTPEEGQVPEGLLFSPFQNLRSLMLHSSPDAIVELVSHLAGIETLQLTTAYGAEGKQTTAQDIIHVIAAYCKNLKDLRIGYAHFTSEIATIGLEIRAITGLASACRHLKKLELLCLSADLQINGAALYDKDIQLISSYLPNLEVLHLQFAPEHIKLSPDALLTLGRNCRSLEICKIRSNLDISILPGPGTGCLFPKLLHLGLWKPTYINGLEAVQEVLIRHFPRLQLLESYVPVNANLRGGVVVKKFIYQPPWSLDNVEMFLK